MTVTAEYDGPWKDALDLFLEPCLRLFTPEVHAAIDWTRGWESLDKELERLVPHGATGKRVVDKLVRVWLRSGDEVWVLLHCEVQAQRDDALPERMYVYDYRIFDRHRRDVASFAILADDAPGWRPGSYERRLFGSRTLREYTTIKLLDWEERWEELRASRNPFAVIVMAHLKALRTRGAPRERLAWKVALVEDLYRAGYGPEEDRQLFRFIDWLLALPPELEREFDQQLDMVEQEARMPFVTPRERAIQEAAEEARKKALEEAMKKALEEAEEARKKALEEARQAAQEQAVRAIVAVLEARFGPAAPQSLRARLQSVSEPAQLELLIRRAATVGSVEELAAELPDAP